MPASALIPAVGSVAGAAIGGKGAKSAANTQAQSTAAQIAASKEMYAANEARYQPDIEQANRANDVYSGLLGTGGDPALAAHAYDTWRNSAGFKSQMRDTLDSVNANAYARGLGRSGAAYKSLQDRAAEVSDKYQQTYLANVDRQVGYGANAKAAIAGAGQNMLAANNSALQAQADATGNAQVATSTLWGNAIQNVGTSFSGGLKKKVS